jgi:tetratricopeptide (TPR) repeat protein
MDLRRVRWLALLCTLAITAPALAGPKDQAKEAFKQGTLHFNLGEYAEALGAFKDAYRAYPDPTFLYNLAQCERALGHKPQAVRFYKTYLAHLPDAPNRVPVEEAIAQLDKEIADEENQSLKAREEARARDESLLKAHEEAVRARAEADALGAPRPNPARRAALIAGLGLSGLTVMSFAVATGLYLHAQDVFNQAQHQPTTRLMNGLRAEGADYRSGAYALFGIGGAAAAGTVVAFIFYARAPKTIAFASLTDGGAQLSVAGRF